MYYTPTNKEEKVSRLFQEMGILLPEDLDEEIISQALNIYLLKHTNQSYSYQNDLLKSITLSAQLNQKQRRERFYHELSHIVTHVGNQSDLPPEFRYLQEIDARHFTKYAAIPFHMIPNIDWEEPNLIQRVSDDFKIPHILAQERLNHIQSRMRCRKVGIG